MTARLARRGFSEGVHGTARVLDHAGRQTEARGCGRILRSIADKDPFRDEPVDQRARAGTAVDQHEVRGALPVAQLGAVAGRVDELL